MHNEHLENGMRCVISLSERRQTLNRKGIKKVFGVTFIMLAIFIAAGSFYACQKEKSSLKKISHHLNKIEKEAVRTTSLTKLENGSWRWSVTCTYPDGTEYRIGSIEDTKRQAKKAIKNHICKSIAEGGNRFIVSITSEFPDNLQGNMSAFIFNGFIEYLTVVNPWTNESYTFTQKEISANALAWLSELTVYDETLSSAHELVIAQLKVWDVYLGGDSVDEIKVLHNLTTEHFEAIAKKSWNSVTINMEEKDNGTIYLDWNIK